MCVWSGSKDENAKISQYTDTAAPDQSWRLDLIKVEGEGADAKYYYRIVNVNSNLALTALGTENDLVTQKKYTGADNQLWAMTIENGAEKWQHGDPIDDTKITQKTYSFLTDTANSDGWINKAEWKVTVVPSTVIGAFCGHCLFLGIALLCPLLSRIIFHR